MRAPSRIAVLIATVSAVLLLGVGDPGVHAQELDVCSEPGTDILDFTVVTDTMTVDDDIEIGELHIAVDITHTFIGDLDIIVTTPASTEVQLLDNTAAGADVLVTFAHLGVDHGAMSFICDCEMKPSGPGELIDPVGESTMGDWELSVEDSIGGDAGTFDEWCVIVFEDVPIYPVTNLSVSATDDEGVAEANWTNTIDYDDIDVFINDVFEETLSGPFLAGDEETYTTDTLDVPQTPVSICLVPIVDDVDGNQACDGALLVEILDIFECSAAPLEVLGDGIAVTDTIEVVDESFVEEIQVQVEITTVFNGWALTLDSPAGSTITLNAGFGDGADVLALFALDGDPLPGPLLSEGNRVLPTGPGSLSDFVGEETNGDWDLGMTTFDGGTLDSWCVNLIECDLAPPIEILCEVDGDTVEIFWTNNDTYDSIDVYWNNELLETIDGAEESYLHEDVPSGRQQYSLRGFSDTLDCGLMSERCVASPGLTESCASTDVVLSADGTANRSSLLLKSEETIDSYFDIYVDLTTGDGSTGSADLIVTSPTGTVVVLHNNQVGGTNFDVFYSDDGLPNDGTPGRLAPGSIVAPAGPGDLGDFTGENTYGTWNMDVYSFAGGTLNQWCIAHAIECEVASPLEPSCTVDGLDVTFEWANDDTYDEVEILRNGALIATLVGDAESFSDTPIGGYYTYRAVGVTKDCRVSSQVCEAFVGLYEACDDTGFDVPDTGEVVETTTTFDDAPVAIEDVEVLLEFSAEITGASLESPEGTTLNLIGGGLTDCLVSDTVYYDLSGTIATNACMGCRIRPLGPGAMADFSGEIMEGDWTIGASSFILTTLTNYCIRLYEACDLDAPSDLTCTDDPDGTILEWSNDGTYDSICVIRFSNADGDGLTRAENAPESARIAVLDGEETTYTDEDVEAGRYRYFLQAYDDTLGCSVLSEQCIIAVGRADTCSEPDAVIEGDFLLNELTLEVTDDDDYTIRDTELFVDITTTFTDSSHFLTSPDGTIVQTHAGAGGGISFDCWFADGGIPNNGSAPFDCGDCVINVSGPGAMEDFDDEDPDGTWTFGIQAFALSTVNEWCVGLYLGADDEPTFYRGDVTGNGVVSALLDALFLLLWMFDDGDEPPCFDAADTDDNGSISALLDALFLLLWMFDDGPEPPDPGVSTCGPDPTDDTVDCLESTCP